MAVIVKKFGGKSLLTDEDFARAVSQVQRSVFAQDKVVVVVSASAGVTSNLLSQAERIGCCSSEIDSIISSGEQIQAGLFALALQKAGIRSRSFLGWQIPIVTNAVHQNAKIEKICVDSIKDFMRIGVPVVAGFQGVTSDGRITTIGRGGSDITAVALAIELGASCAIYKDVDGVYPVDPKIVSDARPYESISDEDLVMLSECGSKVLHKDAALMIQRNAVPTKILSSKTGKGTRVVNSNSGNPAWGIAIRHLWRVKVHGSYCPSSNGINAIDLSSSSENETYREFMISDEQISLIDSRSIMDKSKSALISIIGWRGKIPVEVRKSFASSGISIYHSSIALKKCSILVDADRGSEALLTIYRLCWNGGSSEEKWLLAGSISSN